MRLLLYTLNVFLIQIFDRINLKLFPYDVRWSRNKRLCYSEYELEEDIGLGKVCHISCCDCGASHLLWQANDGIYGISVRPKDYSYRFRLPTDTVFADEDAAKKWNTNR